MTIFSRAKPTLRSMEKSDKCFGQNLLLVDLRWKKSDLRSSGRIKKALKMTVWLVIFRAFLFIVLLLELSFIARTKGKPTVCSKPLNI